MEQSASSGRQAVQAGGRFLSLDRNDRFNRLARQARGLAYLLGHAADIKAAMPERLRKEAGHE